MQKRSSLPTRRAQRYHERRAKARRRVVLLAAAGVSLLVIVSIVVLASRGDEKAAPPFVGSTLQITLGDYSIEGQLTAPAGNVRLQTVNAGGIRHNIGVRGGPISGDLQPGDVATIDIGSLAPGKYQLYCDLVGHVEKGMIADLIVTDSLPVGSTAA
jgi:manganese oxidase